MPVLAKQLKAVSCLFSSLLEKPDHLAIIYKRVKKILFLEEVELGPVNKGDKIRPPE